MRSWLRVVIRRVRGAVPWGRSFLIDRFIFYRSAERVLPGTTPVENINPCYASSARESTQVHVSFFLDKASRKPTAFAASQVLTFPSVKKQLFQPSTLQRSAISVFSLQTPYRSQVQRNSTRSTATTQQERQETKDRMGSCWFHMP